MKNKESKIINIKARTVMVNKHKTSLYIENDFWSALKKIAKKKKISINKLVSEIDRKRTTPLSRSVRLYVLNQLQNYK